MMFEVVRNLLEDVDEHQREAIYKAYLNPERTHIKSWPATHKKACVIMEWVGTFFKEDMNYSEKEVNAILKTLFPDFVMLRRLAVDIGLLSRDLSGSSYKKRNP
jgi:hypothetical protein